VKQVDSPAPVALNATSKLQSIFNNQGMLWIIYLLIQGWM